MATDREMAIEHRNTALQLNRDWGVGAKQCRYRDTSDWYKWLERFPAAYFDPNGYVLFATKKDYLSAGMRIGKENWLPSPGIAALPGYVRVRDDDLWAERRLEILRALVRLGGQADTNTLLQLLSEFAVFTRKGPREEEAKPPKYYFRQACRKLMDLKWVASTAGVVSLTDAGRAVITEPDQSLVEDVREVNVRTDVGTTDKDALVKVRLGQGEFRQQVLQCWVSRCAVTGSQTLDAIRASHIKPWRESTDRERLDPENGIPLIATLDALFDKGLISFSTSGKMIVSSVLSQSERRVLGIRHGELARKPTAKTAAYLAWHRREHGFDK